MLIEHRDVNLKAKPRNEFLPNIREQLDVTDLELHIVGIVTETALFHRTLNKQEPPFYEVIFELEVIFAEQHKPLTSAIIFNCNAAKWLARFGDSVLAFHDTACKTKFASAPFERIIQHLQAVLRAAKVPDLESEFIQWVSGNVDANDFAFPRQ